MTDKNFDDDVIEDENVPLPSMGKVKLSVGAAALRQRLAGVDISRIRTAKPVEAEETVERLSKRDDKGRLRTAAPKDNQLVLIFAQLHAAGASQIDIARVKKVLKTNWPEFTSNTLTAADKLAECELAAERRSRQMNNEDQNIIDVHGFVELCNYGYKKLEQANRGTNPTIFMHGTELVRIPSAPSGEARIEILQQKSFNHALNTHAPFRKTRGDSDYVSAAAPREVTEHLYADPALPVPTLEKIVTVPTFTKDGALIETPGYHKNSGLLYSPDPGLVIPSIPTGDLTQAAKEAAAYLIDIFGDMPFDGCTRHENVASPGASLTNFLGLMLTPFVAPIIDDVVPAHLLTKPAPGTGASLLAEACQIVVDGKTDLRPPLSKNEEERRKALFTALQTQKNYTVYDNVAGEMDSATMASFLTSREWTDRVLGRTGERTVKNATATVWTGINPGFSPELQRRISLIKLDAKVAKPGDRDPAAFKVKGSFKDFMYSNRGKIIAACLTLIRHWIQIGKPKARGRPLASFEKWHWTIGGILEAAGLDKFQTNRDELEIVTGGEGNPMQALVQEWHNAALDRLASMSMEAKASGDDGLLSLVERCEISLPLRLKRDALSDFDYSPKSFGTYLSTHRDSTFKIDSNGVEVEVSLTQGGRSSSGTVWRLVERKAVLAPPKPAVGKPDNIARFAKGCRRRLSREDREWLRALSPAEEEDLLQQIAEQGEAA
jgi:hypothetical protein